MCPLTAERTRPRNVQLSLKNRKDSEFNENPERICIIKRIGITKISYFQLRSRRKWSTNNNKKGSDCELQHQWEGYINRTYNIMTRNSEVVKCRSESDAPLMSLCPSEAEMRAMYNWNPVSIHNCGAFQETYGSQRKVICRTFDGTLHRFLRKNEWIGKE